MAWHAEQENLDVQDEIEPIDTSELPSELNESKQKEKTFLKPIEVGTEKELLDMTRMLSEEQMIVLSNFVDNFRRIIISKKCPEIILKAIRVIATGGAGVGKTFVIKIVSKWAEKILRKPGDHPLKPKVLILGPTGMAASLIDGTTFETGLSFKFGTKKYLPLRDAQLESFRNLLEELELIIMDEFSMIKSDRLYDVQRRMEEIFISKDLFAGRSVMMVGDIMQLPPVKGRPVFSRPFSVKNRSMFNSTDNIWKSFDVVTLKVSQRQKANEWRDCLNRIRVGEASEKDKALLETRRLAKHPNLDINKACHVFYTNEEVNHHNEKMLNNLNSDLVKVSASGIYPRGYKLQFDPNGFVESTPFMKELCLKKGSRIMLTFNVNLVDSLVNGSLGTVLDFVYDNNSKLKAVIIRFDDPEAGKMQRLEHQHDCHPYANENGTPIYRKTLDHTLKLGGGKGKTIQFPIRLSWASTCHKLQGVTIKEGSDLVVHGPKKKAMPKNMYYVMMSRCSGLYNPHLDEEVDLD